MTRALEVIDGSDISTVVEALQRALSHDGPAILPRDPAVRGGDAGGGGLPGVVPRRVVLVVETSGSTGAPKRVMLSADALLASAAATEGALGGPGQWLLALPAHYIAGLQVLVRSIAAQTAPLVQPPGHFDVASFAALADRLEAPRRYTSLVPTQLARLASVAETDADVRRAVVRFDAILVGGQALPRALHERAVALGFSVVRTYGSSETAGGCVYDGRPIGSTVVRENLGEIEISGPSLAEGYLGDEALTADRFHTDAGTRWYRTSDGGAVSDGLVRISGRLDNVIISGGVKVSLDQVERLVQGVDGFEQAVVVAAADEIWGQVPVVVVAGHLRESLQPAEALDLLRRVVTAAAGRPAAPAELRSVDVIPRLSSGKPDRLSLASWFQGPAD